MSKDNFKLVGILYKNDGDKAGDNDTSVISKTFTYSDITTSFEQYLPIGRIIAYNIYQNRYQQIPVKIIQKQ
jgi:hypothetical protein